VETMRRVSIGRCRIACQTVRWLALVAILTVAGCAGKPKAPPKDKVQDMVRASLPPFLVLEKI